MKTSSSSGSKSSSPSTCILLQVSLARPCEQWTDSKLCTLATMSFETHGSTVDTARYHRVLGLANINNTVYYDSCTGIDSCREKRHDHRPESKVDSPLRISPPHTMARYSREPLAIEIDRLISIKTLIMRAEARSISLSEWDRLLIIALTTYSVVWNGVGMDDGQT
jgi:hypothetical protein